MTTRIAVITDVHANLPALQAALREIEAAGCDAIYCTGDVIGIGPYPAECLDLILNIPHLIPIMGNHDDWFADGLPEAPQPILDAVELAHHRWVHAQLDPTLRAAVAQWPYAVQTTFDDVPVAFLHYALTASGREFQKVIRSPTPADLDQLFAPTTARVVFYGHHHPFSDLTGAARYVNPGALGCHTAALARYSMLETLPGGQYTIAHHAVPYDDAPLFAEFERRHVPDVAFLRTAFFGGR
jgi:predicted phosphodiesterase